MKTIRKILYLAVLLCLSAVLALPAWAATPTPTPVSSAEIVSYKVYDSNGKALDKIANNQTFTLEVTLSKEPVQAVGINSQSFTFAQGGTVSGTTVTFKNVTYRSDATSGASDECTFIFTFKDSALEKLTLSIGQCIVPTATATPTPAPSAPAYSGEGVYPVAFTLTNAAGAEITTVPWDGKFNLVLRVADYTSGSTDLTTENIAARVNSTVFTYTGIAEVSQLTQQTDANGAEYCSYLLLFRDVTYHGTTGSPDMEITVSYLDGARAIQTLKVTLGQCSVKDPNSADNNRTSTLVVRDVNYGTQSVVMGTPFTLTLGVYSTTGTETLNDVIVSLTLPEGVNPAGGNLSQYVGDMKPKTTSSVSFTLNATTAMKTNVAVITVKMTGIGAKTGTAASGETTISIPVQQADRFEVGDATADGARYVGSEATVSVKFVNKSQTATANVDATITGENFKCDEMSRYVGNVNAGTEGSVEFDITPQEAGQVKGTITITYELTDGTVVPVIREFGFAAEEAETYDSSMYNTETEPEQTGGLPIWAKLLGIAAAVIAAIVAIRFGLKKWKAYKLKKLDIEDDDDFDSGDSATTNSSNAYVAAPGQQTSVSKHEDKTQ